MPIRTAFVPLPTALALALAAGAALAQDSMEGMDHAMSPAVVAADQDVSNGIVSAESVTAPENGWLVVHRTDAEMAPGPVVGHAPLRAGENTDVAAILTEPVAPGDMLMLMVHSEAGGTMPGIFEYTLGSVEDGPIRIDDQLVMQVITAQ